MLIGVVGKSNVGKSTFFKAATLADIEIANYPFATIKPNHGVGFVRIECVDKEFNKQCSPRIGYCTEDQRFVAVDMIDVAGLVPGAHKGAGLGNQFLNDLNQADVLIHVIDISGSVNEKGEPVKPLSHDPAADIAFLEEELDFWYLDILKKGWEKFARQIQQEHKDITKALGQQLSGVGATEEMMKDIINNSPLNKEKPVEWTETELLEIASEARKRTKPMIIAANKIDVPGAEKNLERIKKDFTHLTIVPASSESELALREAASHGLIKYLPGNKNFEIEKEEELTEKQKKALRFIKENVLEKTGTGVQEVLNKAVFEVLEYIAVFPVANHDLTDKDGNTLPDCFLMPKNATPEKLAYKIHSDIGENFVKAVNLKKNMPVGKDSALKHGDVMEIHSTK